MRKFLTVVASVFVIVALVVPSADAQAPAGPSPKVTINGLVDNVTSWGRNISLRDGDLSRVDKEWYARLRARPDITGELGSAKFVLGLELDLTYGSTCPSGNDVSFRCSTEGGGLGTPVAVTGQHSGTFSAADMNTDVPASLEVKWAYTEFALPWAPAGSIMRLGAQPFTVTHKLSALATGDFPGAYVSIALTPQIKVNLTYAQIEEQSTGVADGFFRGDDFAFIGSVDISPFKGLDLRPLYAYLYVNGATSTDVRSGRGGLAVGAAQFPTTGLGTLVPGAGTTAANFPVILPNGGSAIEERHTIGLDAKWTYGPFYLDPTFLYQWGHRDFVVPTTVTVPCTSSIAPVAGNVPGCVGTASVGTGLGPFGTGNTLQRQTMNAYLLDVTGGWRSGPLLIEGRFSYTSGNKANEDVRDPRQNLHYFQAISTDAQWWGGWGEISTIGIDYFNSLLADNGQRGLTPNFAVGYDKYGLIRGGARASYALTPAFTVRGSVIPTYTAEKVNNDGIKAGGSGVTPGNFGRAISEGSRYLGTEIDAGITWRFAPGLTFDLVGGYMFIGDGYSSALATANPATTTNVNGATTAINRPDTNVKDVSTVAARVRYSF